MNCLVKDVAIGGFYLLELIRAGLEALTEDEKQKIISAIERSAGNKTLAAKILNIDRKTLYNKIHQYGLEL